MDVDTSNVAAHGDPKRCGSIRLETPAAPPHACPRFEVGFIDLDYNALDSGGPMQFLLEEMCHGNVDNAGASGIQGVARISKLDVTYNTMIDLYGKAMKIKDASCRRRRLRRAIDLCNTVQTPFIDLRRAVLLQEPPSVPTLTGGGGGAREAAVIDPSDERLATMSLREQTALLSRQWQWRRARDLFDRMRALPGYAPNDIHYDIVIRHLAHACRWAELRQSGPAIAPLAGHRPPSLKSNKKE
uniref:Uncharacterized protein n=1 Tax=Oryza glumipatula TaxID=40148 RepID=A0A0D9Z2S7_9ORYZ